MNQRTYHSLCEALRRRGCHAHKHFLPELIPINQKVRVWGIEKSEHGAQGKRAGDAMPCMKLGKASTPHREWFREIFIRTAQRANGA